MAQERAREYIFCSHRTRGDSRVSFVSPPRRVEPRTGVTVKATRVEVSSEMMKEMPSGFSIRPSMPDRKNSGRKQAMMIRVEFSMGIRTSREAS